MSDGKCIVVVRKPVVESEESKKKRLELESIEREREAIEVDNKTKFNIGDKVMLKETSLGIKTGIVKEFKACYWHGENACNVYIIIGNHRWKGEFLGRGNDMIKIDDVVFKGLFQFGDHVKFKDGDDDVGTIKKVVEEVVEGKRLGLYKVSCGTDHSSCTFYETELEFAKERLISDCKKHLSISEVKILLKQMKENQL